MTGIKTAFRLEIEGLGIEAVTDPGLEQTLADGRQRVVGLLREGLQIEESCDIARAEVESSGMMVSIVDREYDDIWTEWLSGRPSVRTWLIANVASTIGEKFYVSSTAGFSVGDVIHVGTEAGLVGAISSTEIGPYLAVATAGRGYWSTTAQHHYTQDGADLVRPEVTLTRVSTIEGRRARLYRYVLGTDDLQGDGTQIWQGLCTTDAKLSEGTTWSIQIDPLTSIFAEDLGSDLEEPLLPRGIHYPEDAPFDLTIAAGETSPPNVGSIALGVGDLLKTATIRIVGFWEDNAAFCEYLTPILQDAMLATPATYTDEIISPTATDIFYQSISARATTGGGWEIIWQANSDGGLAIGRSGGVGISTSNAEGPAFITAFSGSGTVSVGETVHYEFKQAQVPRGMYGRAPTLVGAVDLDAGYSGADIYLDKPVALDASDTIELSFPGDETAAVLGVVEVSDALNRVRTDAMPGAIAFSPRLGLPEIHMRRQYATGSLYDFLTALTTSAPAEANKGAQPFLVASDLSLTAALFDDAIAGRSVLGARRYASNAEVELGELIAHECRLLSIFPHLDSQGRITFSRLRLPTSSAAVDFVIDDSNRLVDQELPTWERNTFGSFNTVTLKTGYSPAEEEHQGPTYQVRDVTALSARKNTRELEIEPLSLDVSMGTGPGGTAIVVRSDWTYDDAVLVAGRVLGIFGRPYLTVTFEAPYTLATTCLVGAVGRVSFPRLPNTVTASRGLSDLVGIVIGRAWALDMEERLQLTMLVQDAPIAGYAPSATLSAGVDGGGNLWSFTLSLTDPEGVASMAPAGVDATDLFIVGDEVEVIEWNSATQTPQTGAITAVTASAVTIQFDGVFTEPTTYYMRVASGTAVVAGQEDFAFWAGADDRIDFATGTVPAQVWSA